ncbi:MAG: DUF3857 domain-containing protein [Acidobacteriota bacterium]
MSHHSRPVRRCRALRVTARCETGVVVAVLLATLLALAGPSHAADFPEITAAEKAFGQEGDAVPAVVLFDKAELRFGNPALESWSELEVWKRTKVLTEEGVSMVSDIAIPHGKRMRMMRFEARTVLPDGTVIPVGDDAVFREQVSRASRSYVTKIAMPSVQVGAILDVHVVFTWPDIFYLSPWYFDNDVPTMRSEFTYHKPDSLAVRLWSLETAGIPIQRKETRTVHGKATTAWMERIPALPKEPFSFPASDLANRFMVIPHAFESSGRTYPIFESWELVSDLVEDAYKRFLRAREVKKRGQQLAASGTARERAETLFRFVRDEIRTDIDGATLGPRDGVDAEDVLAAGFGTPAEKSLVLVTLLDGVKIDARPAWAANRLDGRIDANVPNPSWFDWPLVAVELDGATVFLDPSDPGLAFGQIAPHFEGMPVLLIDDRDAELVEVPFSTADANRRDATVDLTLDDEGRLVGTGRLELRGARAWAEIDGDDEGLAERWRDELLEDWPGFDVEDLTVTPEPDAQRLLVEYALRQRDEDVLGDESSLAPSRPLRHGQPFTLPPKQRLTPVQFLHAARDEVTTTLRWPEGWSVEVVPRAADNASDAGRFVARCEVDEAQRQAVCHRTFERLQAEYLGQQQYTLLQSIYETAAAVDAEPLVLVAP